MVRRKIEGKKPIRSIVCVVILGLPFGVEATPNLARQGRLVGFLNAKIPYSSCLLRVLRANLQCLSICGPANGLMGWDRFGCSDPLAFIGSTKTQQRCRGSWAIRRGF